MIAELTVSPGQQNMAALVMYLVMVAELTVSPGKQNMVALVLQVGRQHSGLRLQLRATRNMKKKNLPAYFQFLIWDVYMYVFSRY